MQQLNAEMLIKQGQSHAIGQSTSNNRKQYKATADQNYDIISNDPKCSLSPYRIIRKICNHDFVKLFYYY